MIKKSHSPSKVVIIIIIIIILHFSVLFFFFRAAGTAYRSSRAMGPTEATVTGLHYSHSNARSEPHLRPIPQLTAMPDP